MFKHSMVLTFYGLTPIHMGSGTSVSYVDNPIQREKHTDFPILASSGIKGAMREFALRIWNDKEKVEIIFGPEQGGGEYASCISFTDAKILLYPVRSVKGVFAYITCPYVLKRFRNELRSVGIGGLNIENLSVEEDKILVCSSSKLKINDAQVALEEFVFIDDQRNIDELAKQLSCFLPEEIGENNLKDHLAIVSDDVFRDFVKYAVEVRTRIRIDQTTGTVAQGALFTIELVPAESVFYGFLFVSDPYLGIEEMLYKKLKDSKKKNKKFEDAFNSLGDDEKSKIKGKQKERIKKAYNANIFTAEEIKNYLKGEIEKTSIIQLGGDETLGMGLVKVKVYENQGKEQVDAGN